MKLSLPSRILAAALLLLAACAFLVAESTAVAAGPCEDADFAYDEGDFATAPSPITSQR